ncbi:MAG: hypothetical protein L0G19_05925 [Micrococcales bacterium]|nr:hypothetical protein [Micrococcales bacterium]
MSPSASERTSGNGGRGPVRTAVALSASVVLSGMLTSAVIAGPVQATEETPVPDGPAPSVPVTDPSDVPVPEPSQPAESTEISESQARADEYWLDEYGVRDAWKASRGEGATIAIIDTGVDGSHPDLEGAVSGGTDVSGIGAANGPAPGGG